MEEIGLFEAIYSQRQITRYKPDPVPMEAIKKIIEAATKAPSGANCQPWEFVVITDGDLLVRVSEIYRDRWLAALGSEPKPGESPAYQGARYLAKHMHEVPVLIVVCVDHSRGYVPYTPGQATVKDRYASSIWLAVQNLFLAARGLGLGTRITTTAPEPEIKAALGIPDPVEVVAIVPVGYPKGRFGPTDRRPAAQVTHHNAWGNREQPADHG